MKTLLRSTTAYKLFSADVQKGSCAHTTLVVFPDEAYLRDLLKECAKAFFLGDERICSLIERESFSDCIIYPERGGKLTVQNASDIVDESLLRPVEGDKKLFVLDGFHSASVLVQNKLLKVLEEPPEGVFFLLGAIAEQSVLPTVLSRSKRLAVSPFSEEAIEEALRRGHAGESGLKEAAVASGGIYSVAEAMLGGGGEDFRLAEQFLEGRDVEKLCRAIGERKEKKLFFAALKSTLRDLTFLAAGQEKYCSRKTEKMKALVREYPCGALLAAVGFVGDAEKEIQFNANAGQAAFALYLRLQKEKEKWKKLS